MRIVFLVATLLTAWAQSPNPGQATVRDLAVFRAAIEQRVRPAARLAQGQTSGPWLVLFDITYRLCDKNVTRWCISSDVLNRLEAWSPNRDNPSLYREFVRRNSTVLTIANPDAGASILESSAALEGLDDDTFWVQFRTQYPGTLGWVRFSAPVYGDEGDAVVYAVYACGALCAEGWLVHLVADGSGWHVTNWTLVWDS
jgi:hypothetical protein